jgi:hypothetical protein
LSGSFLTNPMRCCLQRAQCCANPWWIQHKSRYTVVNRNLLEYILVMATFNLIWQGNSSRRACILSYRKLTYSIFAVKCQKEEKTNSTVTHRKNLLCIRYNKLRQSWPISNFLCCSSYFNMRCSLYVSIQCFSNNRGSIENFLCPPVFLRWSYHLKLRSYKLGNGGFLFTAACCMRRRIICC